MLGRTLGGREPVKELVLLPWLLVPPPLQVSCSEVSWPGTEMDLAVDGGLERKVERGCGSLQSPGQRLPTGPPALPQHSRLKAGVPREQEHANGDLCVSERGDQPCMSPQPP